MRLVRTFCSSTAKNEYGEPHFLFHDFNKDSASFRREKNWLKSMSSFLAILLNCTDWAITGRKARVQFNSTLERKEKTRALKGIFLVRKWINNILFLEGLIFGGAYVRREICVSKSIRLTLQLEVNIPFLFCFTSYSKAIFQVQAPGGRIFGGAI